MPHKQTLAESFMANLESVKFTLADFSDADMMCRPVPAANHAMWQLGHIINSEVNLLSMVAPGAMPALPEGFAKTFGHDMTSCNDPARFPKKQELLDLFTKVREATIQWIKAVKLPELDKPLPPAVPEGLRKRCPTVGHLAMLIPAHTTMHLGQMQVIRRMLGKPVLF